MSTSLLILLVAARFAYRFQTSWADSSSFMVYWCVGWTGPSYVPVRIFAHLCCPATTTPQRTVARKAFGFQTKNSGKFASALVHLVVSATMMSCLKDPKMNMHVDVFHILDHVCTSSRPRPAPIPRSSRWKRMRPRHALLHLRKAGPCTVKQQQKGPHPNSTQPNSVKGSVLESQDLLFASPGNACEFMPG